MQPAGESSHVEAKEAVSLADVSAPLSLEAAMARGQHLAAGNANDNAMLPAEPQRPPQHLAVHNYAQVAATRAAPPSSAPAVADAEAMAAAAAAAAAEAARPRVDPKYVYVPPLPRFVDCIPARPSLDPSKSVFRNSAAYMEQRVKKSLAKHLARVMDLFKKL